MRGAERLSVASFFLAAFLHTLNGSHNWKSNAHSSKS